MNKDSSFSEFVVEFESDVNEGLVGADSFPIEVLVVLELHVIAKIV